MWGAEHIYHLYLFLCTAQLPVFVFLFSLEQHVYPVLLLEPAAPFKTSITNLNHSNLSSIYFYHHEADASSMYLYRAQQRDMAMEMGIASTLSTLFAILFMCITNVSAADSSQKDYLKRMDHTLSSDTCPCYANATVASFYCCLSSSGSSYFALLSNGDMPQLNRILMQRICFWVNVWYQSYILYAGPVNHMQPVFKSTIQAMATLRFVALWGLCRTSQAEKSPPFFFTSICIYLYWAFYAMLPQTETDHLRFVYYNYDTASAEGQKWSVPFFMIMVCIQFAIDFVLVLGHHYDQETTLETVLNCRLFYTACFNTLLMCMAASALCIGSTPSLL